MSIDKEQARARGAPVEQSEQPEQPGDLAVPEAAGEQGDAVRGGALLLPAVQAAREASTQVQDGTSNTIMFAEKHVR